VGSNLNSNQCKESGQQSTVTEVECDRLLVDWNCTKVEFDRQKCVHQLFERQSAETPHRPALIFRDQVLSYKDLNTRSERLAVYLQERHGIGPESVVAICMTPSIELMVALFATLKAGGAYLPVDPTFPAERISFMLRDSRAAVILTQEKIKQSFQAESDVLVVVDNGPSLSELLVAKVESHNLAYLMYTSGSTGVPKGVMVEHRNVVNFFVGMDRVLGIEPGVWLAVTSVSFDISVLELLWTLTHGFTVVLQPEDEKLSMNGTYSVEAQLRRHQVTHLQCTPTLARTLIRLPGTLVAMNSLRKLLLGGESLPLALVKQLTKDLPAEIYNMYGPTETTIWSTAYKIPTAECNTIPIGRPIANTSIYLLDQQQKLVPIGASGELYIGGEGVARGYWNRPELTAERFILSPFGTGAGDRLYKTGDLACYREDGTIEFLGRLDRQVKIRGFRIELGEIENIIGEHPAVREVVVTAAVSAAGHQQLVAYVVSDTNDKCDFRQLLIYARQRLPEYMVPAAFVHVDILPTTPNGKVDRAALATFAANTEEVNFRDRSTPNSDLELRILQVWRDALGIDTIGLHDNFFDLGANSLIVAEVAASLNGMGECNILLTDLFAYPTISDLAAYLAGDTHGQVMDRSGAERGALRHEAIQKSARTRTKHLNRLA
jgi:amino acid adenylation domain-containing protein